MESQLSVQKENKRKASAALIPYGEMAEDELATYLDNLKRDTCYQTDAILKESIYERTQRVSLIGVDGTHKKSYIRKYINRDSGLGTGYELLYAAGQRGKRFQHLPIIYECYRIDTELVVIMEDIGGETLQEVLGKNGSSSGLVYDLFPRVCDAVIELHESFSAPIIHRDLKPSNIMISYNTLTLIDFGIARLHKEEAEGDTGHFGTREYAPPEQFGFGQTDVRSDVYSLGMLLYYCLTEETPSAKIREKGFRSHKIPEPMRAVVERATNLDPEKRYQSVRELKQAFLGASKILLWHMPQGNSKPQQSTSFLSGLFSKVNIPRSLGVVWNVVLVIVAILFFAGALSVAFNPPSEYANVPLVGRVLLYFWAGFFIVVPIGFLLWDKRVFSTRFPKIAQVPFWKQLLISVILAAVSFFIVVVAMLVLRS